VIDSLDIQADKSGKVVEIVFDTDAVNKLFNVADIDADSFQVFF
jgi:hypothetical protein